MAHPSASRAAAALRVPAQSLGLGILAGSCVTKLPQVSAAWPGAAAGQRTAQHPHGHAFSEEAFQPGAGGLGLRTATPSAGHGDDLPSAWHPPRGLRCAAFIQTQILSVVRSGSAAGLSPLAFELETLGLTVHSTYGALAGLPFSSYG